jgi:hypothetical protein
MTWNVVTLIYRLSSFTHLHTRTNIYCIHARIYIRVHVCVYIYINNYIEYYHCSINPYPANVENMVSS